MKKGSCGVLTGVRNATTRYQFPVDKPGFVLTVTTIRSPALYSELFVAIETTGSAAAKVAPTVTGVLPVSVHVPVPAQPPPLHPANVEPLAAEADRVTRTPLGYVSVQSVPQLIPVGVLLTVPFPVPVTLTARVSPVAVLPQASLE